MKPPRLTSTGYSLVELLVVIIVLSIMAGIAIRSLDHSTGRERLETTRARLDRVAHAISGNPNLTAGGNRTDFGYVGDIGALPANLGHLLTNPGSYATWNGPYLVDQVSTSTGATLTLTDAWGNSLGYGGGVVITAATDGSTISRRLGPSTDALLNNAVRVTVTDLDGYLPGNIYKDSITVTLIHPDGSGGLTYRTAYPAADGSITYDSVPIGHPDLRVVYQPLDDTVYRHLAIAPGNDYVATIPLYRSLFAYSPPVVAVTEDTLILADFDTNEDGFSYVDDAFRGTSEPDYASGEYRASDGYTGGAIRANIDAVDNSDIIGMSGAWEIVVNPTRAGVGSLTFRYSLRHDSYYESNEYSEVLVSIDGTLVGVGSLDYIDRLYGGGGSTDFTTGWQQVTISLGNLTAGTHTLRIGIYNNEKTTVNENADVLFDDVLLVQLP